MTDRTILVVGGTSGIGLELARDIVARGDRVVITGRDGDNCAEVAAGIGERASSVALDISEPESIAGQLAPLGQLHGLVLAAIERDANTVREYDIARARRLVTLKLIGYTEVVHALLPRMDEDASVVLFGGRAKDRPYPGSTTVSTVNGGVVGMVNSLVTELKPVRVNGLHPGIIGDSPYWASKPAAIEATLARTPTGRLASMADIVGAVDFLLTNRGVNGVQLDVDNGWLLL